MRTEQEIKDKIHVLRRVADAHKSWVATSTSDEEQREAMRHLRETNSEIQALLWVLPEPVIVSNGLTNPPNEIKEAQPCVVGE